MSDLQILIAAFGPEALKRIANLPHPEMQGVEYLVSWQNHESQPVPSSLSEREDFKIFRESTIGLCHNRNALLKKATASHVLISDDDLSYSVGNIKSVINGFRRYPDCDFLTFRYESENDGKTYPAETFTMNKPPKGYFTTSMELALNLASIRDKGISILFNTAFGVNGTHFGSGEEDILIASMLRHGLKGRYIPDFICFNTESTTSERNGTTQGFIQTKGAVMLYVKPHSWVMRMLTHAIRASRTPNPRHIPFLTYCKWWLQGVKMARNYKVFENQI